jgi:putative transcriptional regulator
MNCIKAFRNQANMTQEDLASALSLTQGAITHYENGRRTPDLDLCRKIVSVFIEKGLNATLDAVFPPKEEQPKAA